jgi:hypothetical protein
MESQILTTENNKRILHIEDVITHEELRQLLENQEFDYIFQDNMSELNYPGQEIYMLPLFAAKYANNGVVTKKSSKLWQDFLKPCTATGTKTAFNFMINKKQINRYLCIKLVEFFELTSFDYTWSGIGQNFDMATVINDLDELGTSSPITDSARTFLLLPITTQPKVISRIVNPVVTKSYIKNSIGAWGNWALGLKPMFEGSAVSLITESTSYDPSMVFTEKTLYATIGLTFPIWVGGYHQAQNWQKLGFDTFNDVIDHSYQHYDTLIERCYYAIKNNLKILQDVEYASQLRNTHMARLQANDVLLRSGQLERFCRDTFKTWPQELQHAINDIVQHKLPSYPN